MRRAGGWLSANGCATGDWAKGEKRTSWLGLAGAGVGPARIDNPRAEPAGAGTKPRTGHAARTRLGLALSRITMAA